MVANKISNLRKCGEILFDIKSKDKKNKIYMFQCTFCNLECDQLKKFSNHIGEKHLSDFQDILEETELKVETVSEEYQIQEFNSSKKPDCIVPDNTNENPDPLDTVGTEGHVTNPDFLNCEVKLETIENDESINCDKYEINCVASLDDSDKEENLKFEKPKSNLDTKLVFNSDSESESEFDINQEIPPKKRKINFAKKCKQPTEKNISNELSSDESKDADADCNKGKWKSEYMDTDEELKELLISLKGVAFFELFKEHNISTIALQYITPNHLNIIVPKPLFGKRIIFEHYLNNWQNQMLSPPKPSNQSSVISLQDQGDFSIESVLKSSLTGKTVLSYYESNKKLIAKYRRMIASCVTSFIIENDINASPNNFEKIAENIVEYFTTENKELYFLRKQGRKPGGCLYSKYHNSIANLKKEGLYVSSHEKSNAQTFEEDIIPDEDEVLKDKEWLRNNIEPMSDVIEKWNNTFYIRRNSLKPEDNDLQQIFGEWPIYKQPFGHILIMADFAKMFPGKEQLLLTKWETFCSKILKMMDRDVKDKYSLDILSKFKESAYNSDIRDCVIIDLIHSVLKPVSRKFMVIDKRRKYETPSIEDSKQSFSLFASNKSELQSKVKILVEESFTKKQTLQPYICTIGTSVFDFQEFYVYFGGIFYKLENIKSCVDLAFKIFNCINIKYPENCNLIWFFIQEYLFEIPVENNERCNALSTILTDIQTI